MSPVNFAPFTYSQISGRKGLGRAHARAESAAAPAAWFRPAACRCGRPGDGGPRVPAHRSFCSRTFAYPASRYSSSSQNRMMSFVLAAIPTLRDCDAPSLISLRSNSQYFLRVLPCYLGDDCDRVVVRRHH